MPSEVVQIAATFGAFAALRRDGRVVTWGDAGLLLAFWGNRSELGLAVVLRSPGSVVQGSILQQRQ